MNQPFGLWRRMSPTVHDRKPLAVYPFFFQTTRGNGYAFMAGGSYFHDENDSPNPDFDDETHRKTWQLDVDPAVEDWVGDDIGKGSSHDPVDPGGGAVMYAPDKILKGGANVWSFADPTPQTGDQDNNMYLINMSATTPQWTEIDPLIAVRRQFHLVALPDGRVLAVGGQDLDYPNEYPYFSAVYTTEWIDPDDAQDEWAALADMPATYPNPAGGGELTDHRSYHSGAVLMPDGSVFMGGGQLDLNHDGNYLDGSAEDPGEFNKSARIFKPPYLYAPEPNAPAMRPTISNVPSQVGYNANFNFNVSSPTTINQVVLMRPCSTTHNTDMDQRRVPLTFRVLQDIQGNPAGIRATSPLNGKVAPPGYYMLFVLRADDSATRDYDIPSQAAWIKLTQ